MVSRFSEDAIAGLEFVGSALAPFYLTDPSLPECDAPLAAIAAIDPEAASQEWPFADSCVVRDCLASMKGSLVEGDADSLMWEYRRLFEGPAARPAPPWGSVYMDRDCVVFGVTEIELSRWLRSHGIERLTRDRVPEDHMGLMLSQMSLIAGSRPDLLEEFMRDHLLTWSHHFLGQLAEVARHPFYRGLALLTDATLESFREQEGIQIEYPRYYR